LPPKQKQKKRLLKQWGCVHSVAYNDMHMSPIQDSGVA
jgi:hypothetical protein